MKNKIITLVILKIISCHFLIILSQNKEHSPETPPLLANSYESMKINFYADVTNGNEFIFDNLCIIDTITCAKSLNYYCNKFALDYIVICQETKTSSSGGSLNMELKTHNISEIAYYRVEMLNKYKNQLTNKNDLKSLEELFNRHINIDTLKINRYILERGVIDLYNYYNVILSDVPLDQNVIDIIHRKIEFDGHNAKLIDLILTEEKNKLLNRHLFFKENVKISNIVFKISLLYKNQSFDIYNVYDIEKGQVIYSSFNKLYQYFS